MPCEHGIIKCRICSPAHDNKVSHRDDSGKMQAAVVEA